jgi:osmotically-inducible protein OsmY
MAICTSSTIETDCDNVYQASDLATLFTKEPFLRSTEMTTTFIDHAIQAEDFVKPDPFAASETNLTDQAFAEDVRDAFAQSPIQAIRQLQVEQNGSSILISGRLRSFYHKQLAQEVVRTISPKLRVVNAVEVYDQ